MKYFIPLLFLTAGCVTQADLRRVQEASLEFQDEALRALEEDNEEAAAHIMIAADTRDEEYQEIFEDIAVRIDASLEAAKKIPSDPVSLLLYASSLLATGLGVDRVRDRRRAIRKEAV